MAGRTNHKGETLTPLKRVAATVAASATLTAGVALLAGTAGAATASFPTPAGAGVVTQLVLDNGNYSKCLNDYGQNVNPGAEVKLYSCNSSDPASEWVTYPDNTLRPYLDTNVALTASSSTGDAVLEPVATSGATAAQQWYFDASGMLVNGLSNPGTTNEVLNDPGYVATNGVQVIVWNQPSVTSNAHWWAPAAHYGSSTLSNRPDSGGGGNWANDHMTRLSMVIFQGGVSGANQYQGSVSDTGSFHALAGEKTPNQGVNAGSTLGDSISGSLYGYTGFSFTTNQWVSSSPGSSYSGSNPTGTAMWPALFFQGTKTALAGSGRDGSGTASDSLIDNSGAMQWAWSYTSNKDNCGNVESWVDAQYNGGGQDSGAGNITAPATCPTPAS
jgi:hypothetical protein